jgi:hypothetical protein
VTISGAESKSGIGSPGRRRCRRCLNRAE